MDISSIDDLPVLGEYFSNLEEEISLRLNKFIALNLPTSRRKADELIQSVKLLLMVKYQRLVHS